jgi:hypothetical protein
MYHNITVMDELFWQGDSDPEATQTNVAFQIALTSQPTNTGTYQTGVQTATW